MPAKLLDRKMISLETAKAIVAAALEKANSEPGKPPVTIAIADAAGGLVVLERSDGASLITADIAYSKARTSALYGLPTAAFQQREAAFMTMTNTPSTQNFIFVEGGEPIRVDGVLVGGIGVAGRSKAEDEPVVRAGLAVLEN